MVNEFEIKKQICDIGRRIYNRNMVAANDGIKVIWKTLCAESWEILQWFSM